MNRLNRREFLSVLGGAGAVSMVSISAFASTSADKTASSVTSLYVKGLVMLDLGHPDFVRIGFPKAPGHKATLSIVPENGASRAIFIKGNGSVEMQGIAATDPKIFVPELVRFRELYGNGVASHIERCPSVISIPSNAIRSITTSEVSKERWTFVRAQSGEEVTSFRPRHVAETVKIDLSSASVLKLDQGKVNIPLDTTRELRMEYTPEKIEPGFDPYSDHFGHYFDYVERPAALDFDVVPKKLTGFSSPTPKVGQRFVDNAAAACFLIGCP